MAGAPSDIPFPHYLRRGYTHTTATWTRACTPVLQLLFSHHRQKHHTLSTFSALSSWGRPAMTHALSCTTRAAVHTNTAATCPHAWYARYSTPLHPGCYAMNPPHLGRLELPGQARHDVHRIRAAHADRAHAQAARVGRVRVRADHHAARECIVLQHDLRGCAASARCRPEGSGCEHCDYSGCSALGVSSLEHRFRETRSAPSLTPEQGSFRADAKLQLAICLLYGTGQKTPLWRKVCCVPGG